MQAEMALWFKLAQKHTLGLAGKRAPEDPGAGEVHLRAWGAER